MVNTVADHSFAVLAKKWQLLLQYCQCCELEKLVRNHLVDCLQDFIFVSVWVS